MVAVQSTVGAQNAHADSTCWYYTGNDAVISKGRNNPSHVVKEAQCLLNSYNTWHGRPAIAVDGIFGSETHNAVVAFQKRMKITVDGIVGPQTWRKLRSPGS
ncbi:peptidoglycan-binding protein [Streptomyces sp. TRM68416]|nr:peptidoglycan-binding domain-containing protein [Streptomyces sp. TRM68416]MBD0839283.1 peptidoglycan-binding protein [Streptomyces sp. TRM68416]